MRDPKIHSKVLALRWSAVRGAQLRAARDGDPERWHRLDRLGDRTRQADRAHLRATRWDYCPWEPQPHWRHQGKVIPDTEEEA